MGKEGKPAVEFCIICGEKLPNIEGIRFHAWHLTE